jgi:hypothetical protein
MYYRKKTNSKILDIANFKISTKCYLAGVYTNSIYYDYQQATTRA